MTGPIDNPKRPQGTPRTGGNNPVPRNNPKPQRKTIKIGEQDYAIYDRGDLLAALAREERLNNVFVPPGTDLSGINFGQLEIDLQHVIFDQVNLSGTTFNKNTKIRDSVFHGCELNETNFNGARLSRAKFQEIEEAKKVKFTDTILVGAKFKNFKSPNAIFDGANMRSASFDECSINNATFLKTNLISSLFKNTIMHRAKFRENTVLSHARFFDVEMNNTDFKKSILEKAKFRRAKGSHCEFDKAQMQYSSFLGGSNEINSASFTKANFEDADLSGLRSENCSFKEASFKGTTMHGTKLLKAKMHKANFDGANIQNANMQEAELVDVRANETLIQDTDLSKASLKDAIFTSCLLQNLELHGSNCQKVKFEGDSVLDNVSFSSNQRHGKTNLKRSYFQGGEIKRCHFVNANLEEAGFVDGVNLKECVFNHANLNNTFFSRAKLHLLSFLDANFYKTDMRNNEFIEIQWEEPSKNNAVTRSGLNGRWYQEVRDLSYKTRDNCRFEDSVENRFKK